MRIYGALEGFPPINTLNNIFMYLTLNTKEFAEAVGIVSRFAERRSATLPVLSGIALVATREGVMLRATNLETGIELKMQGTVKTEGTVALPAQTLREITSSLSGDGSVTIEQSGDTVTVAAGKAKSVIKTLAHEDFPSLPVPDSAKVTLSLPGAVLRALITTVGSCASASTVRPELASVLLSAEGGVLKAVATDSFRLAEKKASISGSLKPFSILIPAKNALDIVQVMPDTDVELLIDEHQCALSWKDGLVITRLVATAYPDYTQIIPKSFGAEATLLRKDFESALRRAAIFSDSFQKVRLGLDKDKKQMTLSARNADVGESAEGVPAAVTGESIELSFNHRYLQTPLPLITTESITVSASGIGRPLVIKGVGDTSFLYLVMPMNQ